MAEPQDNSSPQPYTRRVLLAAGGMLLLAGCSGTLNGTRPGFPFSASDTEPAPTAAPPPPESPRPSARPVRRPTGPPEFYVADGPGAVALTLDDGPDPEWTPKMLDLLRKYGISAAFSQIGTQVRAHPELSRAVAAEGHLIVNHTWTHADLARLGPAATRTEIERTSDAIEQAAGVRPTLFRAPYGAWTRACFASCSQLGMRTLDWSVDPEDWARPGSETIVHRILRHTRAGSIILEHDGGGDRSQTLAALRAVLPILLDRGYHFVTP